MAPDPESGGGDRALHVVVDRPIDVQFSFETRQSRVGVGASAAAHVVLAVLALAVMNYAPERTAAETVPPPNLDQIVWLSVPGPGGGGGGGGTNTPEPPRRAETPGKEKISVPVAKPPAPAPPKEPEPEPPPPPPQELNIPAKSLDSGEQQLVGTVDSTKAAEVTESQGSGSGGGAGTGTGTGSGSGQGSGLGDGIGGGTGGGVYRVGSGVSPPRVVKEVKPQYTAEAMRAKVQGVVLLECVVLPDGTVGEARVSRSLDSVFGLDQEAIRAARQWRFMPGMRMGEPVPVLITIELTFTLR